MIVETWLACAEASVPIRCSRESLVSNFYCLKQIYVPAALRCHLTCTYKPWELVRIRHALKLFGLDDRDIFTVLFSPFMSQSPRAVEIELPTKDTGNVVAGGNIEELPVSACTALGTRYLTGAAGLT